MALVSGSPSLQGGGKGVGRRRSGCLFRWLTGLALVSSSPSLQGGGTGGRLSRAFLQIPEHGTDEGFDSDGERTLVDVELRVVVPPDLACLLVLRADEEVAGGDPLGELGIVLA